MIQNALDTAAALDKKAKQGKRTSQKKNDIAQMFIDGVAPSPKPVAKPAPKPQGFPTSAEGIVNAERRRVRSMTGTGPGPGDVDPTKTVAAKNRKDQGSYVFAVDQARKRVQGLQGEADELMKSYLWSQIGGETKGSDKVRGHKSVTPAEAVKRFERLAKAENWGEIRRQVEKYRKARGLSGVLDQGIAEGEGIKAVADSPLLPGYNALVAAATASSPAARALDVQNMGVGEKDILELALSGMDPASIRGALSTKIAERIEGKADSLLGVDAAKRIAENENANPAARIAARAYQTFAGGATDSIGIAADIPGDVLMTVDKDASASQRVGAVANVVLKGLATLALGSGLSQAGRIAGQGGVKNLVKGAARAVYELSPVQGPNTPDALKSNFEWVQEFAKAKTVDKDAIDALVGEAEKTWSDADKTRARDLAGKYAKAAIDGSSNISTRDALSAAKLAVFTEKTMGVNALDSLDVRGVNRNKVQEPAPKAAPKAETGKPTKFKPQETKGYDQGEALDLVGIAKKRGTTIMYEDPYTGKKEPKAFPTGQALKRWDEGQHYYHGHRSDIKELKPHDMREDFTKNLFGDGLYMTDDPSVASRYAKTGTTRSRIKKGTRLISTDDPVPQELQDAYGKQLEKVLGYDPELLPVSKNTKFGEWYQGAVESLSEMILPEEAKADLTRLLSDLGYDGIHHKANKRGGWRESNNGATNNVVILFDPTKSLEATSKKPSTTKPTKFKPQEAKGYDKGEALDPVGLAKKNEPAGDFSSTSREFFDKASKVSESIYSKMDVRELMKGGAIRSKSDNPMRLPTKEGWGTIGGTNTISPDFPKYKDYTAGSLESALKKYFAEFGKKKVKSKSGDFTNGVIEFDDGTSVEYRQAIKFGDKTVGPAGQSLGVEKYTIVATMDVGDDFVASKYFLRGDAPVRMWEPLVYGEKGGVLKPTNVAGQSQVPQKDTVKPATMKPQAEARATQTLFHKLAIGDTYRDGDATLRKTSKSKAEVVEHKSAPRQVGTVRPVSPQTPVYKSLEKPSTTKPAPVADQIPDAGKMVQPAPKPDAPAKKEPWEMTREEGKAHVKALIVAQRELPDNIPSGKKIEARLVETSTLGVPGKAWKVVVDGVEASGSYKSKADALEGGKKYEMVSNPKKNSDEFNAEAEAYYYEHKSTVEQALKEGKPVPKEVLADYPDLAKKYEAPAKKEPWEMTREKVKGEKPEVRNNGDIEPGGLARHDGSVKISKRNQVGDSGWYATLEDGTVIAVSKSKPVVIRAAKEWAQRQSDKFAKTKHRNEVDQALKEGKPVPKEVLADYPDLAKKYEAPAKKEPWEMTREELQSKYQDYISDGVGYGAKYDRSIDDSVGAVAQAIKKGDSKAAEYFGMQLKLRTKEITADEYQAWNDNLRAKQKKLEDESTFAREKERFVKSAGDSIEAKALRAELKKPILSELAKSPDAQSLVSAIEKTKAALDAAKDARNKTKSKTKARALAESKVAQLLDEYESLLDKRDDLRKRLNDEADLILAKKYEAPTKESPAAPKPVAKPETLKESEPVFEYDEIVKRSRERALALPHADKIGFGAGKIRPSTPDEMRLHAINLRKRAESVVSSARNRLNSIPSIKETGASNYQKNFGRKNSKAIASMENAFAKAKEYREAASKWDSRASFNDPDIMRLRIREKQAEAEARARVKQKESAARKSAPIVNRVGGAPMTSAEWAKEHKDYKGIYVVDGVRVRRAIIDGALREVYLTDKPATKTQGDGVNQQAIAKDIQKPAKKEPWEMTREEYGVATDKRNLLEHVNFGKANPVDVGDSVTMLKDGKVRFGKISKVYKHTYPLITLDDGTKVKPSGASVYKFSPEDEAIVRRTIEYNVSIDDAVESGKPVPREVLKQFYDWAMTFEEFKAKWKYVTESGHEEEIRRALIEGKPVPKEVLAEYPDLAKKYDAPAKESPAAPKPVAQFPIDARVKISARNAARIYPRRVGQQFSDADVSAVMAWGKDNGHTVRRDGQVISIIAGGDVTGRELAAIVESAKKATKSELAAAAKMADYEAGVEARRKASEETIKNSGSTGQWVVETFGPDFANSFNKAALIRFLDGEDKAFQGLAGAKWRDGLEKLGFVGDSVDFKKLKAVFEERTKTPAKDTPLTQLAPKKNIQGQYVWDAKQKRGVVTLFENADISTILHETSHHYLRYTPEPMYKAIAAGAGVDPNTDLDKLKRSDYVKVQEFWARGVEETLYRNAVNPNPKVQAAFNHAAKRIKQIYGEAGVPLPERRGGRSLNQSNPQTKTPAFKKWFGDSKVVDENGEPLVVYHGSPAAGHTQFKPDEFMTDSRAAFGKGVYVTVSPEAASGYTKSGSSWNNGTIRATSPAVYPLHARAANPFDLDSMISLEEARRILPSDSDALAKMEDEFKYDGRSDLEEDIRNDSDKLEELENINPSNPPEWILEDHRIDVEDFEFGSKDPDFIADVEAAIAWEEKSLRASIAQAEKRIEADHESWKSKKKEVPALDVWNALWKESDGYQDYKAESRLFGGDTDSIEFKTEANRRLQELGYDALTHVDAYNPGGKDSHRVYILFEPTQIKSAIANKGTFDPNDPSILNQRSGKGGEKPDYSAVSEVFAQMLGGTVKPIREGQVPVKVAPKAGQDFGISNAAFEESSNIVAPVGKGQSAKSLVEAAKQSIQDDQSALALARSIRDGETPKTAKSLAELQAGVGLLEGRVNRAFERLSKNPTDPGVKQDYETARAQLQEYADSIQRAKSEWSDEGRVLAARVDEMGNFARMQTSAAAAKGAPLTPNEVKELKAMSEKFERAKKELQLATDELQRLRAESAVATAATRKRSAGSTKRIREDAKTARELLSSRALNQLSKDSSTEDLVWAIAKEHILDGDKDLQSIAKKIGAEFEMSPNEVIQYIGAPSKPRTKSEVAIAIANLRKEARQLTGNVRKPKPVDLVNDKAAIAKRLDEINKKIQEYQTKLKTGDYSVPTKAERAKTLELENAEGAMWMERRKFEAMRRQLKDPQSLPTKIVMESTNILRMAQLGMDMGQLLRQGRYVLQHKKAYTAGLRVLYKAAKSEEGYAKIMSDIESKVAADGKLMHPIRVKHGLSLTDQFIQHEEAFTTKAFNIVPILKDYTGTLERAQVAFMNTVRAEMFDGFYNSAAKLTADELKIRARMINSLTGRSNAKDVPKLFSVLMTSPRWYLSRWELLKDSPKDILAAVKGNRGAQANLKDSVASVVSLIVPLAILHGFLNAKDEKDGVTLDPASPDFLKIRYGERVYDISAGIAPRVRFAIRAIWGIAAGDLGYFGKEVAKEGFSTVSPGIRTPLEIHAGESLTGIPWDESKTEADKWLQLAPLIVQTAKQSLEKEGSAMMAANVFLEFTGAAGTNRYPQKTGEYLSRPNKPAKQMPKAKKKTDSKPSKATKPKAPPRKFNLDVEKILRQSAR